jgi:hypothetical protein
MFALPSSFSQLVILLEAAYEHNNPKKNHYENHYHRAPVLRHAPLGGERRI